MNAISFRQNEKENKIPHLRHRFGTVEKKQCIVSFKLAMGTLFNNVDDEKLVSDACFHLPSSPINKIGNFK